MAGGRRLRGADAGTRRRQLLAPGERAGHGLVLADVDVEAKHRVGYLVGRRIEGAAENLVECPAGRVLGVLRLREPLFDVAPVGPARKTASGVARPASTSRPATRSLSVTRASVASQVFRALRAAATFR